MRTETVVIAAAIVAAGLLAGLTIAAAVHPAAAPARPVEVTLHLPPELAGALAAPSPSAAPAAHTPAAEDRNVPRPPVERSGRLLEERAQRQALSREYLRLAFRQVIESMLAGAAGRGPAPRATGMDLAGAPGKRGELLKKFEETLSAEPDRQAAQDAAYALLERFTGENDSPGQLTALGDFGSNTQQLEALGAALESFVGQLSGLGGALRGSLSGGIRNRQGMQALEALASFREARSDERPEQRRRRLALLFLMLLQAGGDTGGEKSTATVWNVHNAR